MRNKHLVRLVDKHAGSTAWCGVTVHSELYMTAVRGANTCRRCRDLYLLAIEADQTKEEAGA